MLLKKIIKIIYIHTHTHTQEGSPCDIVTNDIVVNKIKFQLLPTQLTGAVEYTDCISAKE